MSSANSPILAKPAVTAGWFVRVLAVRHSPAASSALAIWGALTAAGVDPEVALAQFGHESSWGTRGYAVTTRNWGNLTAPTAALIPVWYPGAHAYAPGNGYTYAAFDSWAAGAAAYARLMASYARAGRKTIAAMAIPWSGGSSTYAGAIVALMVEDRQLVPVAPPPNPAPTPAPVPAPLPAPTPSPAPAGGGTVSTDPIETQLQADVDKIAGYCATYAAEQGHLTLDHALAWRKDQATLIRDKAALADYQAHLAEVAATTPDNIGLAPLPNHALLPDVQYMTDPTFDAKEFSAHQGMSPQDYLNHVVTSILRPDPNRWNSLIVSSGGTFSQSDADQYIKGDILRQRAFEAYFAGQVPFSHVAGYLSNESQDCLHSGLVDIAAIHDLGA
ncbi:MAG: hypothetical protein ACYDCI_06630 [Candidatus Limnocylindrales bacterium]